MWRVLKEKTIFKSKSRVGTIRCQVLGTRLFIPD